MADTDMSWYLRDVQIATRIVCSVTEQRDCMERQQKPDSHDLYDSGRLVLQLLKIRKKVQ